MTYLLLIFRSRYEQDSFRGVSKDKIWNPVPWEFNTVALRFYEMNNELPSSSHEIKDVRIVAIPLVPELQRRITEINKEIFNLEPKERHGNPSKERRV